MPERRCQNENCGADLGHHRSHARYCGGPCRAAAARMRALSRPPISPALTDPREGLGKAHESARAEPEPHRYPCGLTADEIVAIFIREFDAEEVPVD